MSRPSSYAAVAAVLVAECPFCNKQVRASITSGADIANTLSRCTHFRHIERFDNRILVYFSEDPPKRAAAV